jgi:hypothetical protein
MELERSQSYLAARWGVLCISSRRAPQGQSLPMVARRAKKMARKTAKVPAGGRKTRRWSKKVTETSDAMTLDKGVFKKSPRAIALSLKRSAERSRRRKSTPFRSAMSMLTFYANRGGKNLSAAQKKKLDQAKDELRALYGKAS